MSDDPTVKWEQATRYGIQIDEDEEAWHSGHVDDIVEVQDHVGIVVATESGGVWWIDDNSSSALQLSDTWDNPDVKCLALGPDDPRHMFAGCTVAYHSAQMRSYKAETGSSPVIMETDLSQNAPLLAWNPITAALPDTAGRVTRIVVIPNLRRIVASCARVRTNDTGGGDTGGIFWAEIPPSRFNAGDPPRQPYVWKQAKFVGTPADQGFWDIAVAATRDDVSRDNLEDRRTITLVAGGYDTEQGGVGGGGLVVGQWDSADDLVFTRPAVTSDDGSDETAQLFDNCGTSSVSSCETRPTVLYAACSEPDGRLKSLLRSEDGGRNWKFCGAQKEGGAGPTELINTLVGAQGRKWNNCISAHPTKPEVAALGWQTGPFLTRDGGTSWRLIDGGPHLHADQHALRFSIDRPDSIGNLFVGSDGGVARINLDDVLNPPGQSGQPFRSDYNRNLPTLQCYSTLTRQFYGTLDASSHDNTLLEWYDDVVAGLQDNGNVGCQLWNVVDPWRKVDGGDGGWNAYVDHGTTHVHNSKGAAVTATYVFTGPPPAGPGSFFGPTEFRNSVIPVTSPAPDMAGLKGPIGEAVMQPTFRNPAGQLLVAVAAENPSNNVFGLFRTPLNPAGPPVEPGYHWELIGTLPVGEWVGALGSFHGEKIYVGTRQEKPEQRGGMYVIDVATGSVVAQTVALPKPSPSTRMQGGTFGRIVGLLDKETGETKMFATLIGATERDITTGGLPGLGTPAVQGYVLRLDGDTWNYTAGAGLPNEYLYGFVAVNAPGTRIEHGLLVSTDDAVYISRDEGENWQRASSGLPRRPHCGDLRFVVKSTDPDNPVPGDSAYIYLGTFGRSVWIATLSGPKPGQ